METVSASLPESALVRNYFAKNTVFTSNGTEIDLIAKGYAEAVEKSIRSARWAIALPSNEHMAAARWDEAVAQTLESVLGLFSMTSDEADCGPGKQLELPRSGS